MTTTLLDLDSGLSRVANGFYFSAFLCVFIFLVFSRSVLQLTAGMHNCNTQLSEGRVGLQMQAISAHFDLAANSGQGPLLLSSGGKGALVLVSQTKPKKKRFRALDKLVLNGQTDRKTHFDTLRS